MTPENQNLIHLAADRLLREFTKDGQTVSSVTDLNEGIAIGYQLAGIDQDVYLNVASWGVAENEESRDEYIAFLKALLRRHPKVHRADLNIKLTNRTQKSIRINGKPHRASQLIRHFITFRHDYSETGTYTLPSGHTVTITPTTVTIRDHHNNFTHLTR